MTTVTERVGVVMVNGKHTHDVMMCHRCGACVTITVKQRIDGTEWLDYTEENIPCCDNPLYFFGNMAGYYR